MTETIAKRCTIAALRGLIEDIQSGRVEPISLTNVYATDDWLESHGPEPKLVIEIRHMEKA